MDLNTPQEVDAKTPAAASRPEPATSRLELRETDVGSVFVSNYPPYSQWKAEHLGAYHAALDTPAGLSTGGPVEGGGDAQTTPLGLYVHIPFCRKRCKFCYFRVYTDKNSEQVERYCSAGVRETQLYGSRAAVDGRPLKFVYFGGGTPSYIAGKHLEDLVSQLRGELDWSQLEEFAFECEPGTLSQTKLATIRNVGVTRLSLGVEHFNDGILELNGRAHVGKEIHRVRPWIEALDFDQLNIDLIAGMLGETWETWRDAVEQAIDYGPDSVTIYQMELPFNTEISKLYMGGDLDVPLADWELKRAWQDFAFERFAEAGYEISSAYTMVRRTDDQTSPFLYRDSLWRGADMLGIGVSSFGHMGGVHVQNKADWIGYHEIVEAGGLPISRAYPTNTEERLVRETILQLKRGHLELSYFADKFGVNLLHHFADPLAVLAAEHMLTTTDTSIELTRAGLLRVDSLLPEFYSATHRDSRYT